MLMTEIPECLTKHVVFGEKMEWYEIDGMERDEQEGGCDSFLFKALYRHLSQETKANEVWDKTASWIDLNSFVICEF